MVLFQLSNFNIKHSFLASMNVFIQPILTAAWYFILYIHHIFLTHTSIADNFP